MIQSNKCHYLDNAATTKPCSAAIDAMTRCMTETYGNPSSLHRMGLMAQHEVDEARNNIARAIGAKTGEIYFTSGATESNNLALRGVTHTYGKRHRTIVVSAVEHASVRATFNVLEEEGYTVRRISPRADGKIYAADFIDAVDEDTCLVSCMLMGNENGYRFPVEEIFRGARRKNPTIMTHCDAVQGFLKIPISVRSLSADLISFSGHKVHAAKGVGALYVRTGVRLKPILYGGHQEHSLRPGTESVPLIAAFGASVAQFSPTISTRYDYVSHLRGELIERLQAIEGIIIRDIPDASPYVLSLSLPSYRSEVLLHYLEQRGVYVSSGSACSKGASSGVLEAFGATTAQVDSALRVSLCAENTLEDIIAFVEGLADAKRELIH